MVFKMPIMRVVQLNSPFNIKFLTLYVFLCCPNSALYENYINVHLVHKKFFCRFFVCVRGFVKST